MRKVAVTVDQIIMIAELNKLTEITVFSIDGVYAVDNLVLAGPTGPIKVVIKK